METTGLYGIKKNSLKKNNCRIGKKPFIYFLKDHKETLDIDTNDDLKIFKFLLKK